jgi:hypothetical protein
MKKLILSTSLALVGFAASALDFESVPFMNNNINENIGFAVITNNSTVIYGQTNVQYVDGSYNMVYSFGTNYIRYSFGSNPTNVINGFPAPGSTLAYTNTVSSRTNYPLFNAAWHDVKSWSDRNGNGATLNFSITARCDDGGGSGSTNQLTVDLYRLPDGVHADALAGGGGGVLTFLVAITGITNNTFATNLPSAFVAGSGGFRLGRIRTANSTTNILGVFVQQANLNGFVP